MNLELLNWADVRRTRGGGNSLQYGMKINVSGHSNTLRFRLAMCTSFYWAGVERQEWAAVADFSNMP